MKQEIDFNIFRENARYLIGVGTRIARANENNIVDISDLREAIRIIESSLPEVIAARGIKRALPFSPEVKRVLQKAYNRARASAEGEVDYRLLRTEVLTVFIPKSYMIPPLGLIFMVIYRVGIMFRGIPEVNWDNVHKSMGTEHCNGDEPTASTEVSDHAGS